MRKIVCLLTFFFAVFAAFPAFSKDKSDLVVSGRIYCSLKRVVVMPFHGIIDSVRAGCGKVVKEGDVLAQYTLGPETGLKLMEKMSSFHIRDLEMKLAEARTRLGELRAERSDLQELMKSKMASGDSLRRIESEISLLRKKRSILEQRLPLERRLAARENDIISEKLGSKVSPGAIASKGSLVAPIDGRVIWVSREMVAGGEPPPHKEAFVVGVMDPMVVVTRVYEKEVVGLNKGDLAELSVESLPGRTFKAKVSRISWSPLDNRPDHPAYYEVQLEVENKDFALREGFKGKVKFKDFRRK